MIVSEQQVKPKYSDSVGPHDTYILHSFRESHFEQNGNKESGHPLAEAEKVDISDDSTSATSLLSESWHNDAKFASRNICLSEEEALGIQATSDKEKGTQQILSAVTASITQQVENDSHVPPDANQAAQSKQVVSCPASCAALCAEEVECKDQVLINIDPLEKDESSAQACDPEDTAECTRQDSVDNGTSSDSSDPERNTECIVTEQEISMTPEHSIGNTQSEADKIDNSESNSRAIPVDSSVIPETPLSEEDYLSKSQLTFKGECAALREVANTDSEDTVDSSGNVEHGSDEVSSCVSSKSMEEEEDIVAESPVIEEQEDFSDYASKKDLAVPAGALEGQKSSADSLPVFGLEMESNIIEEEKKEDDFEQQVTRTKSILRKTYSHEEIQVSMKKSAWKQLPKPDLKYVRSLSSPPDLEHEVGAQEKIDQQSQRKKIATVRFSTIHIRNYDQTVGDNPSCSIGPPISLDWGYEQLHPITIDDWEENRGARRKLRNMVLSYYRRWDVLKLCFGHTDDELNQAEKEASKEKFRRAVTRTFLPIQIVEEVVQSGVRKTKRRFSKSSKNGKSIRRMQTV